MAGCYGFLIRAIHLSARLRFHCSFHWANWPAGSNHTPASATYFAYTAEHGITYPLSHQTHTAWFTNVILIKTKPNKTSGLHGADYFQVQGTC